MDLPNTRLWRDTSRPMASSPSDRFVAPLKNNRSTIEISVDRKCPIQGLLGVHSRYGLHTRAVTVFRDSLSEGFSHFVTSMTAPVASGWSGRRVGLAPTGKRRLFTAHAKIGLLHRSKRTLLDAKWPACAKRNILESGRGRNRPSAIQPPATNSHDPLFCA